MGSTTFCRGLIIFIFSTIFTAYSLKAQPIANFNINLPVPNCNPAVYSFSDSSTGVPPLSYQWNFGVYSGVNSIFQNPSTTYLNCGTYTVQLIITDGNGDADTASESVTVWCSPTAIFNTTDVSGCLPYPATFNSSGSVAGSGTLTNYDWDFGDGYSGTGSSPNHTYVDAGCKQVTLIVTNSYDCGADTTMTDLLCVYTPPQSDFTSSIPTSCSAPFSVTYVDASTSGLAPYTYEWIFEGGDPATDTSSSPSVFYNSAGNFSTTLIITDANGCTDTIVYNDYVVIANNTADITLSAIQGCPPLTISLIGIASSTPIGYSWTISPTGSISNSTLQNSSASITDTGTFSICLDIDFGSGCIATKCTTVTTHPTPTAFFTIDGLLNTCLRPNPILFIDSSTGSNLSYAWSFMGGSPASANTSTPDTINYVACGTYSASLLVTDDFGCTDSYSTPNFMTTTCPVANFTADPTSGCVPLNVNFNSTSSTNNPVSWVWDFGDPSSGAANTSTSQNPSHTYNNPGCYTISLITTNAEGCKDTVVMPNDVCAGTLPLAAFSATPTVNCANQPIYFTNQSTGTFNYTTYTWDFYGVPPYDNNSNAQNPSHVYNDTGWFDITLIVSNHGCNDTLTYMDMVHLLPPVAYATLTRTCGQPYIVTLNGTSSLGADHYTWVIPSGNPPVAFTPIVSVAYTATGNYTATLFVTNDSTGCTDQMTINIPIRDVAAHFTGTPLSGCAPLTSCMTNTSVDAVSYAWLITNSSGTTIATSTSTNPCFTLSTPGIYSVRLIATDMFGCKDTLLRPAYITVYAPVVDFTGLPLSGCSPLSVDFTDLTTTPTSTPILWSWNFGDPTSGANNNSTLQNPSHTYNLSGWYTVTLSVTDDQGCTKTKKISNYIYVIHPEASFILTDTTVCQGTSACFINTSTGTGLTYAWDFGNGNTSTSSNPCYNYTVNGFYDITLIATDMYGCVDTATILDYVNVTKPTANLIADTLGSSCPPLLIHFSNLSVDVDASSTYYWQFGDGQVSSAPNPTHIYNIAGTFDVTLYVTNQNGCKDTIVFADYITIGGPEGFINLLPTSGCVPHYTCFEATSPTTISFTWNFGDGAVEVGGDSICHTYTSTGTFYSELILNDGVGCVYAIPVGAVVVNGANCDFNLDNPYLCDNGTTQFTDASYGTSPVSQWDWDFGDAASGAQNISTLQNPAHFFASPGTYSISLDITTIDGCTNSHVDTVIVQPAPVTYFARVDSSVCAPDTIHFFDETVSSSPIVNWYWNFDDPTSGVLNTDTLPNTLHLYHFPGTYNVTLTVVAENGCSDIFSLPVYVHDTVIANAGPDHIICNGSSALLTASGGANYSWSPTTGLSNPNVSYPIASPTITTSYTVTISNIYGCFDIDSAVVMVNPLPVVSTLTGNADTCADNQAQATVITTGGTPGYTYLWNTNPIQTSASVINLHGGNTYTVIITDANGCTVSSSLSITDLPGPDINMHHTNSTCGYSNGAAWVTVSGGNGGNIYHWNNGATTATISNLPQGTYDVTVTDQFGCKQDDDTHVNNTAGPTATISANNTTCGNSNSFVNLTANGGTNPKTYNWNTGVTTQDLTNMAAGSYSVTVTDANSCTAIAITTFVNIPGPTISFSQVDATCQLNNGSIDVTLTNGTAPFNYNWNGFTYTTLDLTTIYSGNYNLTVTDANGCTADLSVIISDTPIPSVAYMTVPSTCGNSNGSIDVTVTGGISPYTYVWWNGETTEDLIDFSAGSYGLTVIGANGCISNTIISLNDITAPALTNVPNNNTCGINNGSIDLSLAGGTVPFSYVWSGGETTQDINNLIIGTYAVTVTDGNGCLAFDNATLINILGPTLSSSADSSTCGNANGGIDLITTGGTLPFNYSWSNGATSQDLISVVAGVYSVTITDANTCTATETQTINNINGPAIFYTTINSTCGNSNGSIDISVGGGTAPYAFDWNNGAFTSEDLTNIPSGIYTVIVTDQHNCTINAIITLNNTTGPTLSAIDTNTTCGNANGIIDLTVSGGTFPFVFDWNSNTYTTEGINNLSIGSYTVVVTDSNLCTATITENIIDVAGPTASVDASDVTCSANNGTVTLTIAGGTSPFTFNWNNGATTQNLNGLTTGIYDVTITDANLCTTAASAIVSDVLGPFSAMATSSATCGNNNGIIDLDVTAGIAPYNYIWSNGATTQNINGLAIGWYYATITDQNLCVLYDSAEVVNINGPSLVISSIDETCGSTNGQVYLSVNNGTSPYTFSWSNGATTQNLIYVLAGSYSVTVNDANGCSDFTSTSIINISGPITVALGSLNSVCGNTNGSVWVQVTGGTAPYSYLWNTAPSQANDTAYNLVGGSSYSVTVTDSNSCVITGTIALINIASPTSSITKINCTCGEFNGAADLTTSAGTAPYSFTWSNGETTEDIDSLQPGTYSVTITDANGCTSISSTNVLDIFGPYISYTENNTTCGNSNGSIDVTVLGGTAPFFYNWNSGQYATLDILNLAAGSFTLELADAAGCQVDSAIILIDVPGSTVSATSTPSTCGYNNGSVLASVSGGTLPFTYSWSNASIDSFAANLFAGTYTVQVTDSNGCTANASTTLTNIAGPTLNLSYANATCGLNNAFIDLIVTNGTSPFTYDWNTGLYTTQDLSNLDSGTYYVVVVDSNTCMSIALQNITSSPAPILTSVITNASCANANGNIDVTITSGTAPYNFYWDNGSTSKDLNNILAGTYYITVTDGGRCVLIDSFTTTGSTQPTLTLASTNANCGINDGSIDLTITSGTLPFIINWSNGSTNEDLDSLGVENYVVTLTDSFGCITSDSVIIIQNSGPELTANATNESCAGNDGGVNIDISGGTLPLTFSWSNGATTEDISGISAGTYFVTVTDANGCSAVGTADVLPTNSPVISFSSTNTNCGSSIGAIDVSVFGGSYPLNYLWSNGATTEDLNSLLTGNYQVTITDASGCNAYATISIQTTLAPAIAMTAVSSNCNLPDGSIDLTVSGGAGPYTYLWSNNETTEDIDSLLAGYYTVSVTDAVNCLTIDSVFVSYTSGPIAMANVIQPNCSVSTGSIDLTVVGGTAPYSYSWNTTATTQDLSSLIGGVYSVTITDATGCQTFGSFSLISISPINLNVTNAAPMCQGGSEIISASGAVTYSWAPNFGLSTTTGGIVLASPTVSMTYTVTGFDSVGCFDTATVAVIINPLPSISSTTSSGLICYGDSALINVTGGSSLSWSPLSGLNFISMHSAYANPTSLTTYTITETTSAGCTTSTSVVVDVMPQYSISVSSPDTNLCSGESTTLIATGAISYTWSPATGLNATTGSNVTATPTQTTTFFVTATNANGCHVKDSIIVIVHPTVVVNVNPFNPTICLGSSINLTATGAVTYTWAPSIGLNVSTGSVVIATPTVTTTYTITGVDSFGCVGYNAVIVSIGTSLALYLNNSSPAICNGTATTLIVSGAFNANYSWTPSVSYLDSIGMTVSVNPNVNSTYTVVATDASGCTGSTTAVVTVNTPPTISSTNATACFGTSTALTVSGAVNYTWFPSAGLSNSTSNTQIAAPVSTTTYTIIGTDLNGCADTTQSVFTVNPLPVLSATPSVTSICNGSSATITAAGALTYSWTPTSGLSATTGAFITAQPIVNTTYTIFGTDTIGCTNSVTAFVYVGAPVTIINTPIYPSLCLGDSLVITLSGASTYQWTPSTGLNTSTGSTVVATPTSSTNYLVIGTDANGCTGFTTIDITINPNLIIYGATESVCIGQNVTLYSSGAYFYMWTPDPTLNSYYDSTVIASPLISTTYTLTGMNMYGCMDTALYSVTVNPLPIVAVNGLQPDYCTNSSIDTLIVNPVGGILFGTGVVGSTFDPAIAGTGGPYYVTYSYTDSFGCSNFDNDTTVVLNGALISVTSANATICNGTSTALTASGGISYSWSPTIGLSDSTGSVVTANPFITTTYFVNGTNANGCIGSDSVVVSVSIPIQLSIAVANDSICAGTATTISVSGAFTYSWSPSVQSTNINGDSVTVAPIVTTTYSISGIDSNGCIADTIVVINIIPQPNVLVNNSSICSGDSATLIAQGATTYNWISLASTNDSVTVQPISTTSYTVIGYSNSCSDTAVAVVSMLAPPIVSVVNDTICSGSTATLVANGAANYSWLPIGTSGNTLSVSPMVNTTYTVIGNNASCTDTTMAIVIVNPIPLVNFSGLNNSYCANSIADTLIGNPIGGIFSGVGLSGNIFNPNLAVGSSATITYSYNDANGCFADTAMDAIINPTPVVIVNNPAICSGDSATLIAQGATSYNWISLSSTNDSVSVQPIITTSYTVIGYANTCSDSAVAVVSMLASPIVLVNNANICSGTSATLIANGAANYTWFPGNMNGATVSVSPLVNTTYTIIGNNGSCTTTAFALVAINLSPVATLSGLNNSYCTNNPADTLIGIPAGGIFSGVGVNGNIFNPSQVAGVTATVTYTYTDVNGCSAIDTQTTTMNGGAFITVNPSISTICNSSTATIMASGANTYTWAPSTGLNVTTGDVVIASPLVNTTYTVSGISASGCAGQTTSEVIIAPNLLINVVATNDSICLGQAITMTATGGTNYSWSPSTFLISTLGNTVSAQPTSNITYTVVATNATGCSGQTIIPIVLLPNPIVTVSTDTICAGQFTTLVASGAANYHWSTNALGNTISVNPASTTAYIVIGMNGACADTVVTIVTVNPLPIINAISSGNFICNGGTIQINASGASTYVWTPSTGLNTTTGATVSASLTSSTTYTVSGIDGNGCANIQSVPVDVALPVIITTNSSDTSICIGQSVALNVTGSINFSWTPSTGLSTTTGTTVTANPIVTTTYTISGTDINGCTAITMVVVNVNPLPVIVSLSTSATLCFSSTVTLSATGAANYFWSPSIGLATTTGNTIQAQPNSSITYSVTGIDILGCSASSSVNILIYPAPSISITSTNPTICFGASTTMNATGANSYSWSPSANLNSTNAASVIANPTSTTTYSVSTIDSNGCSATSLSVVTVQPLPVITSSAFDSTLCFGQSTILSVSGGTTYSWSPSIGLSATTGSFVTANPSVNTTYQIIGFDNFGCQSATTIPVLINPIASVVIPSVPAICPGDFATLAATGAVNYLWSTNALGDSIAVNPVVNTSYSVIGTDANGCTASDTTLVTINPVPTISAVSNQNNLCVGQTSVLTASGANNYEWYPAYGLNTTTGNTVNATPIVSTTYTIIGNNGAGCTNSTTIEIVVYQLPMAAAGPDVDLCEGGFVQLSATGGTSYEWSPQTGLDNPYISNPMASPSLSTTFIVNVGNQNGCYRQDTININIHLKPNVNAGPSQTVCYPNSTQLHGDGASFYNWSPPDYLDDTALQVPTCTPLFDITYTLTVNDSFGCSASDTVSVKVKRPFAITADPDITLCRNDATQLNAFGGNNYLWTPSAGLDNPYIQNPTASPTVTTTYIVNSTDGICFSSSDTVVVTVNQLPIVSAGADVDLLYGSTYQLYGYTNASNVQWSPSDFLSCTSCIDPVVNHLNTPMTYVMTATDSSGCRAEAEVHISLTCNEDLVYVPNAFTPNGDNKNDIFRVRTYGLSEVKAFRVFNRWGEMVFETYDVNQGWDGNWNGQACAPAVFVYYLEGTCANGQEVLKHGNVSLIR